MPAPNRAWWHLMWNTYGTWLPGDPRGFRNRHHRIHSSGDYRNPPPPGEHAGLHRYNHQRLPGEVVLRSTAIRRSVCDAMVRTLVELGARVMVVTVCRTHVHLVVEWPIDRCVFKAWMTKLKIESSKQIAEKVKGRGWGRGSKSVLIRSLRQRSTTFEYVRDRQEPGAAIWTYKDPI
ncbi:MAG: hypothetical protein ACREJC_13050, partial [Tepidisphaeraceae bacterium]